MKKNVKDNFKKWTIIGSFSKNPKGGTSTFCDLIFEKENFEGFNFYFIDSTIDTIPKDMPFMRIRKSFIKFRKLISSILYFKPVGVMLFAGHGWGLLEKFAFILISKLFRKKIVFFPRSGIILNSRFDKFVFYYSIYFSDFVICQSAFWKNYVDGLNPKFCDKSKIIYNGIKSALKPEFVKRPSSKNEFSILYIGWLENNKGILDLIEAIQYLEDFHTGIFTINILGKGTHEGKIKAIIQKYPDLKIHYQGWQSGNDKTWFFQNSHCLVIPSYYEGFPNVILEAMNSYLPVIATNTTSIPEILDNGNCGLLYNAGNREELIKCILQVKNFPKEAESRARKAKERVKNKFDIEISKRQLKEVLKSF